jgi:putative oxidoreductase
MTMNVAYTLGRILLPLVFVVSGIQKLTNVSGIARSLANNNVPIPEQIIPYIGGLSKYEAGGYAVGSVEVICGLMILIGLKARWGALILVVFTACTIFFVHHFWDMQGEAFAANMTQALKNLSIIGGLLLIVACGSGPSALDRG